MCSSTDSDTKYFAKMSPNLSYMSRKPEKQLNFLEFLHLFPHNKPADDPIEETQLFSFDGKAAMTKIRGATEPGCGSTRYHGNLF